MAIYTDGLAGLCNEILESMDKYQGSNYAFKLGKQIGALDFILSPQNTSASGVSVSGLETAGEKLRKARVVYDVSGLESDITTGTTAEAASLCDTPEEPEPLEVIVDIDDAVATPVLGFSNNKLMQYCKNPETFMQDHLFNRLQRGREVLAASIMTAINAGSGINYEEDGTTTAAGSNKSVEVLDANGNPKYVGMDEILGDYENNWMSGVPAIIGNGKFARFMRLQQLACCNATTPYDVAIEQAGVGFYKDQNVLSVLGNGDDLLLVAPGATQLITFNENRGIDIDTPTHKHLVINDPVYGSALQWDLDFKWDECTKTWIWFARVYFRVFNTFQADAFPSGSPRDNMTGIFKYRATQAA